MSRCPQLQVLLDQKTVVEGSRATLLEPDRAELGCSPLWQEDWPILRHLPDRHPPLPPTLSLLFELRVGSCLSKGWGHTAAAEMHLLGPIGDTSLARWRDIWSAREFPSPSIEP